MKSIIRLSVLLTIIFFTYSCFPGKQFADSKNIILPLSDPAAMRDGSIVYGLPRTVFTVKVDMERTINIPGPYAQFAGDLLGLTDVIQTESESWSIKGITVKTHDELDPSEFYVIFEHITVPDKCSCSEERRSYSGSESRKFFIPVRTRAGQAESDNIRYHPVDLGSDEYFQMQRDTVYKRMNIDSSFVRVPYIVEKKRKLTIDQLAEKAAKRLMEMRDGKHLILTGEATVFPQSDAAINEINRLEKGYTELFTGKTLKDTFTFSYQIIPQKAMVGKPEILFQFSDLTGPVTGNMKGGKPVMVEFNPEKKTKDLTLISNVQSKTEGKKFDKLFYRVPDVVEMKISLGSEILFNSRKLIYQFGEVVQLPANYIIGK